MAIAKISRPIITDALQREHLFRSIDFESRKQAVWVSGPAGSGKTTLISTYLDSRHISCLWYQFDERDNDVATFFYYMGLSVERFSDIPVPLPTAFNAHTHAPREAIIFAKNFFERLFGNVESPFFLVFDNYQDLPTSSPLHRILSSSISVIPEGVTTIFISRTDPLREFSRARAHKKMGYLGWPNLKLSLDESKELFQLHLGNATPDDDVVHLVHTKTDGWAAGITLFIEKTRIDGMDTFSDQALTPSHVIDYFAREIFEHTYERTEEFLIKTAFLSEMTIDIAKNISGMSRAGEILEQLAHGNFFITKKTSRGFVYQYHPLFHEYLKERAREFLNDTQLFGLMQKTAIILETTGDTDAAFRLFSECDDYENCLRIVLRWAPSLLAQGRFITLQAWIGTFPPETVKNNPWLLYWKASSLFPFDLRNSFLLFRNAFELFEKITDPKGALQSWAAMVECIILEKTDFSLLDPLIEWIDTRYGDNVVFPSPESESLVIPAMIYALTLRKPDYKHSQFWLYRAEELLKESRYHSVDLAVFICCALYSHSVMIGNFTKASYYFNTFAPVLMVSHLSPLAELRWYFMNAMNQFLMHASHEGCIAAARQGFEAGRKTGVHIMDGMFCNLIALGTIFSGDSSRFRKTIDEYLSRSSAGNPIDHGIYHSVCLHNGLVRGDYRMAIDHGRAALNILSRAQAPLPVAISHIGCAHALFELKKPDEAREHLADARKITMHVDGLDWEMFLLIPVAYHEFRTENENAGTELLVTAFRHGNREGLLNTLFWRPDMMGYLCAKALQYDIEPSYASLLIEKRTLYPPDELTIPDNWPFPLKIKTLGTFEIIRNGAPLSFSGKGKQKPLALLKAVLAYGGKDVDKEEIIEALWPETDGDLGNLSFKFTIHQLRKLIGNDHAIRVQEGKVSLDWRHCWVDYWAFLNRSDAIEKAFHQSKHTKQDPDATMVMAVKTLGLYGGHFLENEGRYSWIIFMREKVKNRLYRLIARIADHYEYSNNWKSSLALWQKAIEFDCLNEEYYRRAMHSHLMLGQRSDAVSLYNRCSTVLEAVLKTEPSQETVKLLEKIRNG